MTALYFSRDEDYGQVKIMIEEVLRRAGISKNRLAHLALMQRSQLNAYCKGEVQWVDLAILARLCCALGCTAGELL